MNESVLTQQESIVLKSTVKPPTVVKKAAVAPILMSSNDIKEYLTEQFAKYGISEQVGMAEQVISCESGFQVDPPHNNISWGVAQFTPATWKGYGFGNIMNPYSQLNVMAKMWSMGLQRRWDCYRFITDKKTPVVAGV